MGALLGGFKQRDVGPFELRCVTYNVGRLSDWANVCKRAGYEHSAAGDEQQREALLKRFFEQASQDCDLDFLCLQEVDRSVAVHRLLGPGYECFGLEGHDCVVAWNVKRWRSEGRGWSGYADHAVGVTLRSCGTELRVHVCSAHVFGYNIWDADDWDRKDGDEMLLDILKLKMDMTS
jgi:hypothetical protein